VRGTNPLASEAGVENGSTIVQISMRFTSSTSREMLQNMNSNIRCVTKLTI